MIQRFFSIVRPWICSIDAIVVIWHKLCAESGFCFASIYTAEKTAWKNARKLINVFLITAQRVNSYELIYKFSELASTGILTARAQIDASVYTIACCFHTLIWIASCENAWLELQRYWLYLKSPWVINFAQCYAFEQNERFLRTIDLSRRFAQVQLNWCWTVVRLDDGISRENMHTRETTMITNLCFNAEDWWRRSVAGGCTVHMK